MAKKNKQQKKNTDLSYEQATAKAFVEACQDGIDSSEANFRGTESIVFIHSSGNGFLIGHQRDGKVFAAVLIPYEGLEGLVQNFAEYLRLYHVALLTAAKNEEDETATAGEVIDAAENGVLSGAELRAEEATD